MADAIIALLVIAVSMTALLNLTHVSSRSGEKAEARLMAALVARAIAEDQTELVDEGSVQIHGNTYSWMRHREAGPVDSRTVLQIERISVQVSWGDHADANRVEYKTATWRSPHAR